MFVTLFLGLTFAFLPFSFLALLFFTILLLIVVLSIVILPVVVIVLIFLFTFFFSFTLCFCLLSLSFRLLLLLFFYFVLYFFLSLINRCLLAFFTLTSTFIIRLLGSLGRLASISGVLLVRVEVDALEFAVVGTAPVTPLDEAHDDLVKGEGAVEVLETPDLDGLREAFDTEVADRRDLPVSLRVVTHIDTPLDIGTSGNTLLNVRRIPHISIIELRLLRL